MAELAACLTLVAPAGMSADDRAEWLKVARVTIGDVPQGAMQAACEQARRTVKRVSDLVPFIAEKVEGETWKLRSDLSNIRWQMDHPPRPALPPPPVQPSEPFTVQELLDMTPHLRRIARRNEFADAETFAEVDRILDERQSQAGEA